MTDDLERLAKSLSEPLKLKMLWMYFPDVRGWWRDVGSKDGGERICCSGHECGCYGADYASQWEWWWREHKGQHLKDTDNANR